MNERRVRRLRYLGGLGRSRKRAYIVHAPRGYDWVRCFLSEGGRRTHVAGNGLSSELLGEDDCPFPSIAGMTMKYLSGLRALCLSLMSHSLSAMAPENLSERERAQREPRKGGDAD
jgi:hypothetical protein